MGGHSGRRLQSMISLGAVLCLVGACGGQVGGAEPTGGAGGAGGIGGGSSQGGWGGSGVAGAAATGGVSGSGSGGAGAGLTCRTEACGGDLLGTWHLVEICGDLSELLRREFSLGTPACQNVARSMSVEQFEHFTTFSPDGTRRVESTVHYRYQLEVDPACFGSLGSSQTPPALTGEDCDQLANLFSTDPDSEMSCDPLGVDCGCQIDLRGTFDETDSYSVIGSTLTTSGEGPDEKMSFCAEHDGLVLNGLDANGTLDLGLLYARD